MRIACCATAALVLAACGREDAGDLAVSRAWARAQADRLRPAAAYLTIANGTRQDATLRHVACGGATAEVHESLDARGLMRMERREAVIVPGRDSVVMRPGGLHLMLTGLTGPLAAGDTLRCTLYFESGNEVVATVPVLAVQPAP